MYGQLFSVLLMGMVPAWGTQAHDAAQLLAVAPPAIEEQLHAVRDAAVSVTASGAIVMDLESGQVLFERNADVARPMASLTKLMTSLIAVEHHDLSEKVRIPQGIADVGGNALLHMPPGETLTVGDLLSAALIGSSNEAAVTLAEYHSGNLKDFAAVMNERAKTLGLRHTTYENPTGFDAPLQTSTPRDLAWLALFVLRNGEITKRMSTAGTDIVTFEGTRIPLLHTHQLLHDDPFVIAGKTGTTDAAGECLLSIVEKGSHRYVVVLLHSRDRYGDTRKIEKALPSE